MCYRSVLRSVSIILACFLHIQASHASGNGDLKTLELPYGQGRNAVMVIVQKDLDMRLRQIIRASNDPIQRASLGEKRVAMANTLANSYHATVKDRSHYRLSPISGFVAIGPESGVLHEKSTGDERYLLFHNDRLYGAILTLESTQSLPELVERLSSSLGKPSSYLRKSGKSENVVFGIEWKKGDSTFLLKDFSAEFGVRILARLHTKLWTKAKNTTEKTLKKQGPGDRQNAEDLLEEFLER